MDERIIIDLASGLHGPLARDERYPQLKSVGPLSRTPPPARIAKKNYLRRLNQRRKGTLNESGAPAVRWCPLTYGNDVMFREVFRTTSGSWLWGKVFPVIKYRPGWHIYGHSKASEATRLFWHCWGGIKKTNNCHEKPRRRRLLEKDGSEGGPPVDLALWVTGPSATCTDLSNVLCYILTWQNMYYFVMKNKDGVGGPLSCHGLW